MSTFKLAPGWERLQLSPQFTVYYNYHTQVFSLAPVTTMATFAILASKLMPEGQSLSTEDLNAKIQQLEQKIKQNNNGVLPDFDKYQSKFTSDPAQSLAQNCQNLSQGDLNQKIASNQASEPQQYITSKEISEIKGLQQGQEIISALTAITRQEFQLDPQFEQHDRGNNCTNSSQRFVTICRFHHTQICAALGQNKKDGKSKCAHLALFKTAHQVYSQMYGDDKPPEDYLAQYNNQLTSGSDAQGQGQVNAQIVPDDQVTLSMKQLLDSGSTSKLFATYQIWQCFKIYLQCIGWRSTEHDRTNPHQECNGKREQAKVYLLEVYNDLNELKYNDKQTVSDRNTGRKRCAVNVLQKIYGPNKKWLELVDEVFKMVNDNRAKRGAPDKTVIKPKAQWILEQNQSQGNNSKGGNLSSILTQSPSKKRSQFEISQANQEEHKEVGQMFNSQKADNLAKRRKSSDGPKNNNNNNHKKSFKENSGWDFEPMQHQQQQQQQQQQNYNEKSALRKSQTNDVIEIVSD